MNKDIEGLLTREFNKSEGGIFSNNTIEVDGVTYSVELTDDGELGSVTPIGGEYTGGKPAVAEGEFATKDETGLSTKDKIHQSLIMTGLTPVLLVLEQI